MNLRLLSQQPWFDCSFYEKNSRFVSTPHGQMHYLDVGQGAMTILVHGTPGWSYEWRHLIPHLPGRVIVVDHIGFGLSDRPEYPLNLNQHVENFNCLLSSLLSSLATEEVSFVLHDFGGTIGLESLLHRTYMIKKIVLINTWFWPLSDIDGQFARYKKWFGSAFMEYCYSVFGFSAGLVTKYAWGKSRPLSKEEHKSFYQMQPRGKRQGTIGFLRSATNPGEFYMDYENKLKALEGLPSLLIWGRQDRLLGDCHVRKWQEILPEMPTILLSQVGHWPQLEDHTTVAEIISQFLSVD